MELLRRKDTGGLEMAKAIVINAKLRRTGVCGATETLLVDLKAPKHYLPSLVAARLGVGLPTTEIPCGGKYYLSHGERDWPVGAEERCKAADVILLPEIPFTIERVCEHIRKREFSGRRATIIMVAEGVHIPPDLPPDLLEEWNRTPRRGAVSHLLAEAIIRQTGREVRVTVLGHTQRGGTPSPFDRVLSTRFGVAAVEMIAQGKLGHMAAVRGEEIIAVPLEEAVARQKLVDPNGELVRVGRSIGICFGS